MSASDGFHLESLPYVDVPGAAARDVERVFDDDEDRGEHIVLTRGDGSFLHAAGEGEGPYMLVFHDDAANRHYQAHAEFSREEVKDALIDFLNGGPAWWDENDWTEIKHGMPLSLYAGLACLLGAILCGVLAYLFW